MVSSFHHAAVACDAVTKPPPNEGPIILKPRVACEIPTPVWLQSRRVSI